MDPRARVRKWDRVVPNVLSIRIRIVAQTVMKISYREQVKLENLEAELYSVDQGLLKKACNYVI